ncbi:glycoside hydrolase domain-containing protein [Clostridium sp. B9]|uniref:glycoside hydrolase domain-containing protein n=1 Tax=Clostridium sp. B9 TaxID=3423224 RepID=UPI003D2EBFBD
MKLKSILSSILVGTLGVSMFVTSSRPMEVYAKENKTDNGIFQFSGGFSGNQGENGWYYKENVNNDYSDMTFSNGIWSGSHVWSRIYRPASIHPGPTQDAVLAFRAPRDGNVMINGNVKKELNGGDGVKVQIKHNDNKVWPANSQWQEIESHDSTGYDHEISLSVKEGDYIYFAVNNNGAGNISADNTSWNPVIIYDDAEIEAGLMGGFASKDKHYMQEDFYGIRYEVTDKSWQASAWKNEKLSTEIVLTTDEALTGLTLEASDLVDGNGNTIDSENIELNFMEYVLAEGAMMPDMIDIAESVDMTDNGVQPVWVTVNVPETAIAGNYTGTIRANAADGKSLEFNVNLEVLDIALPSPDDWSFHLDLWQNPYSVARYYDVPEWSNEHMELLRPHLERLQQAGQKVITTTIVKDPWNGQTYDAYGSMVDWTKKADGTFEFDFTNFDKYVELCLEIGIDEQINCYTMVPWENRIFYYDESLGREVEERLEPGSAKWNEYWRQFIDDLVVHVEEKGWTDITYIAMDERPVYTMEAVFDILEGTPLKVSGAMNYAGVGDLVDNVDDMSMAIHHVNDSFEEIIDHRKELGHNTTYYVCTGLYPNTFTKRSLPSEAAWLGWYAAKIDADGFLRWAYDSWVENPLETTDHVLFESGDCFMVYPERSSIRFERLVEGIQDNEKMRYIDEHHSEWSLEIDKILEELQKGHYSGDGVDFAVEVNDAKAELETVVRKIINGEEPPRGNVTASIEWESIVEAGKGFDYALNLSGLVGMNGLNATLTYDSESLSIAKLEDAINMTVNEKLEVAELVEVEPGKVSIKLQAKEGTTLTDDAVEIFKLSFESLGKTTSDIVLSDIEVLFKNGSPVVLEDIVSNIKVVSQNVAEGKPAIASTSEASYGRGP